MDGRGWGPRPVAQRSRVERESCAARRPPLGEFKPEKAQLFRGFEEGAALLLIRLQGTTTRFHPCHRPVEPCGGTVWWSVCHGKRQPRRAHDLLASPKCAFKYQILTMPRQSREAVVWGRCPPRRLFGRRFPPRYLRRQGEGRAQKEKPQRFKLGPPSLAVIGSSACTAPKL